jgi:hypothetical protein
MPAADATPLGLKTQPAHFALDQYPHFCAKWIFTFSACGAGGRIQPGVERGSAEPQEHGVNTHQAREAGGSFLFFTISSSSRLCQWLPPASRACAINPDRTWGCAALPPRLYSDARVRGLRYTAYALCLKMWVLTRPIYCCPAPQRSSASASGSGDSRAIKWPAPGILTTSAFAIFSRKMSA